MSISPLTSGWKFSFFTAIGIGLMMGAGIGPALTMAPGVKSGNGECPMSCGHYRLIIGAACAMTSEFAIRIWRRIGRPGSETSTGTDAIASMRYRMSVIRVDGKRVPAVTIENGQEILTEMTGERERTPVGMIGKRKRTPAAAKEKTNTKTRPANNQGII